MPLFTIASMAHHNHSLYHQPDYSYLLSNPPQPFYIEDTELGSALHVNTPPIGTTNSPAWNGDYMPTLLTSQEYLCMTPGIRTVPSTPSIGIEYWIPPSDPHPNPIPIFNSSSFVSGSSSTLQFAVHTRQSISPNPPDYPRVPQRPYALTAHKFTPTHPIEFKVDSGEPGIRLSAAHNRMFTHLKDRDDLVFELSKSPTITMRLEWPGYASWHRQVRVLDSRSVQQSISREKLAYEVAKTVHMFSQPGNGKRSGAEGAPDRNMWSLGEGNIGLDDLLLVRVENVSRGSWQPQFLVRRRH
ncbi:hypothetical protein BJ322DRAFT_837891 [Thelephora terrestris]|uniref:Uncharacterized protein n=1 Tax=Thelephora terrestris TaxID=56493 RepID=A0A9P6HFD7_9AGAM|nr:hypothetical protein BJ322DRAFT_837891 [Thelephora terrestris]